MRARKSLLAFTIAAALSPQVGFSEDDVFDMSLGDILEIEVAVASNVITDPRKQPVSVSTIDRMKIDNSGARTLSDLLTIYVPGYFTVEDQDDTIAGFRGLVPDNNSKVMLLLNGQNINTEWFWGPPDAILNGIDLDYIERIEVIRGPGSVTLGQGALMGVINIVTTKATEKNVGATVRVTSGEDNFQKQSLNLRHSSENGSAYLYISQGNYDGQQLRNEGWAAGQFDQGLTVAQRNHRLKRSEFSNLYANFSSGGFEANMFRFESTRDLYNWYRDREAVGQTIEGANFNYTHNFDEFNSVKVSARFERDDYALYSHGGNATGPGVLRECFEDGVTNCPATGANVSGFVSIYDGVPGWSDGEVTPGLIMGGVREQRKGIKALFKMNNLFENNKLAFGAERNEFKLGLPDSRGNNFIINEEIQRIGLGSDGAGGFDAAGSVNDNNAWVKEDDIAITSFFAEDFYSINEKFDVFAAVRFDDHPNWGSQVSPRIGALFAPDDTMIFRFTWQTGFRGAVGVQFSGGFVQDGFLAEQNFDAVNAVSDTIIDFDFDGDGTNDDGRLEKVDPETIESVELAMTYTPDDKMRVHGVLFFNTVEDILTAQAHNYDGLGFGDTIGLDPATADAIGTWGGNWYYQNQSGQLKQWGLELEFDMRMGDINYSASHAHVEVQSADDGTIGVYVLPGEKTATFPEDVTRFQFSWFADKSFSAHYNHLYYWEFNSPTGTTGDGNNIGNLSLVYQPGFLNGLKTSLHVYNLFDSDELSPINGTGNLAQAVGSPSVENRSIWLNFEYSL